MKPYRLTFAASGLLVLAASTFQVLLPVIVSLVVIDHVIRGEVEHAAPDLGMVDLAEGLSSALHLHPLAAACLLYAIAHLSWAACAHAHRLTLTSSVIKGLRDLRLDLFSHLERRPSSFYDRVATGRVMTRVTNDIEALYDLLRGIGTLIGEFVPFLVALTIMLTIDAELTLILLLTLPVMGAVTWWFRRTTRELFRLVRASVSALNQNMQENLAGLQVVQLSGREAFNLDRYTGINRQNLANELRSGRWETLYGALNDTMAHVAIGIVLYYGAGEVIQDRMSLGSVILFTRFIDMLFHPIVALGEQTNILFRAMASGERIFQALDWDEHVREPAQPAALPSRLAGEIEFRAVDFAYDPGVPVLRDVSFTIRSGEKLAIVGPTGSGKSTLIRLLGPLLRLRGRQHLPRRHRPEPHSHLATCAGASASSCRISISSPGQSPTTSHSATPPSPGRPWCAPRNGSTRTRSSRRCRTDTKRSWRNAARTSRRASGNCWPSPGCSPPIRKSWSSTKPPHRSTPKPNS